MISRQRTDDLVEIQQLLAKYAVTITQGDIEGLVAVFTPDGTYSAFGETYALERFPVLVDAAPKGLFMTGTAVVDLDGDTGDRHPAAVLHRPLHARHADRLLPRHLRAHRRRLAAEDPCHDVHPAQRRPRPRAPARDRRPEPMTLHERRRSSGRTCVRGSTSNDLTHRPATTRWTRTMRSSSPGCMPRALRRGLDALRLARIDVGGLGGPGDPARDRRRGGGRPRPRRTRPVLDARGAHARR